MPTIRMETPIAAAIETCFDLARDAIVHQKSLARTGERLVAGPARSRLVLGDVVTWEARHLGVRQRLTARIIACDPPRHFADQMVRGAFSGFTHSHEFFPAAGGTLMIDTFTYTSPLGPLGTLADRLFLCRYMRNMLWEHNQYVKRVAEAIG